MKALILTALVVLSALVAPATAIQHAGDTQVQQFEQIQDTEGHVEFESGLYTATQGDITVIPIKFTDIDEATVIIGDEDEVDYELVATVVDGNDDGVVDLEFNMTAAGDSRFQPVAVTDEDDITIEDQTSPQGPLKTGDYDLELHVDGELEHLSTLSVSPMKMSLTDESKLLEGSEGQVVEAKTNIQPGTELDVYVRTPSDADAPFAERKTVTVREDKTFAATFDLSEAEHDVEVNVTVEGPFGTVSTEQAWVEVRSLNNVSDEPFASDVFAEDAPIEFQPEPSQVITGTTSTEPGTEVIVVVQSSMDTETPFVNSETAVVQEDGTFAAEFDFSDVESGTEFTIKTHRLEEGENIRADAVIRNESHSSSSPGQPGFGFLTGIVALLVTLAQQRRS